MSEALPEPLTPADCDLRGMEWMPLHGNRLFTSDFEARATDLELRAALRLWWMAWQQVPAASLPDDDAVLCRLAGLGRDIRTWKRLREGNVLHGFVICSDGRFYHRRLAEQAIEAWDRRVRDRDRKAAYRARQSRDKPGTKTGTGRGQDEDVPPDKTRQDMTWTGQDRTSPSSVPPSLRSGQTQTGSRFPDDWSPSDELRAFAASLGLNPSAVFEGFRDYWRAVPGTRGRKADWSATWRNWCRKEADRPQASAMPARPAREGHMDRARRELGLGRGLLNVIDGDVVK